MAILTVRVKRPISDAHVDVLRSRLMEKSDTKQILDAIAALGERMGSMEARMVRVEQRLGTVEQYTSAMADRLAHVERVTDAMGRNLLAPSELKELGVEHREQLPRRA